jgi:hypothetical protein
MEHQGQASVSPLLLIRHNEADGMPLTLTRLLGLQLWFEIPIWNIKELFNCRNSSLVS